MEFREKIESILSDIERLMQGDTASAALPGNAFFLNDNDVLCCERTTGTSRYPYDADGLVVWAHDNGYIDACESTFTIFKTAHFAEDPSIGFFAGIPLEDGNFYPISIFGASRQLFEPLPVKRYTVFSRRCAYYIADTDNITFAVRLHVDAQKKIHFAFTAINKLYEPVPFYMASNIEAIVRFAESEIFWDRMSKFGKRYENGSYILRGGDNCLVINELAEGGEIEGEYHTVAKSDVLGISGRCLANALSLQSGIYEKQKTCVNTTELPVAADMVHYEISPKGMIRREYELSYYYNVPEAESHITDVVDLAKIDGDLAAMDEAEKSKFDTMQIKFSDWEGKLNPEVLGKFIKSVQKQVSFCALGKNYAGRHIGIRDVFQQLESSLIWQPEDSRAKIITALNFIMEDGRPPRQFSLPATPDEIPDMDLRKYVDQGVWIISTIYTYLSFTDDWSILDEECSYYIPFEDNSALKAKSEIRDSVLCHIVKIVDFLIRNIDEETGCLRALYGDWNDAIDGLGRTKDEGKEFGTGVSVMASLQLYRNMFEMTEILKKVGGYEDKIALYKEVSDKLCTGLNKYAIDVNDLGDKRIIHGWGDKMEYKLGSFRDCDGKARRSTTANSFWVLSGMIDKDPSMKSTVVNSFTAVKSKYGLMTFDEPFTPDMREKAGRISGITPGTYENAAAYVHASMFAIMALFSVGESKFAWEEMENSVVISHPNCTMTSFVMPNSYCRTEKYEIDGASMGDWYTGSGTVLMKSLIKFGFGINPDLNGLTVQTPAYMPFSEGEIKIKVKGHPVTLKYKKGDGERKYFVDGAEQSATFDPLMNTHKLYIPASNIHDNMQILVEN